MALRATTTATLHGGTLFLLAAIGLAAVTGCGGGGGGGGNSNPAPTTYTISGTVSGTTGVTVTLGTAGAADRTTTTGAGGAYSFSGVANGSYTVTPTKTSFTMSPLSRAVVVNGANQTGVDFTATASTATTHAISGTITKAWGGGLASVQVVVSASGTTVGSVLTNASGQYTLGGVQNGTYTVTPTLDGWALTPTSASVAVTGADAIQDFSALGAYGVTGTVTTAWSTPLAGVSVALSGGGVSRPTATTNASGVYTIAGVPPGSYTVTATLAGYTFSPSTPVTVTTATATRNFTADGAYRISGTVTESSAGLSGVSIALSGGGVLKPAVTTLVDGSYAFTGIPNGSYTLTPTLTGHTISPASAVVNGADVIRNFTSTLGTGYTISGTLRGAGSAPLAGMQVRLTGAASPLEATTDASGAYSFTVVSGGNYTVSPFVYGYTFDVPSRTFNALAGNQTADFTSTRPPPITYTGTVSYAGSRSGPVYVTVANGGTGLVSQAGPFSGRAFTIRNVGRGSARLVAWMDTLGIGHYVSGVDPVATVNVGGNVAALGNLTLVDPVAVPSIAPGNGLTVDEIVPFDQGAVVAFSPTYDTSGYMAADTYRVYWNTSQPVDAGHTLGTLDVPAGSNIAVVKGLGNGTSYWFRVVAYLKGSPIAGQSVSLPTPTVPGAPTGSATVSGTVSYPTLPAGAAIYVVAGTANDRRHYVQRIASPAGTSSPFSLSVPPGTYRLFVLLDLDDSGWMQPGEPSSAGRQTASFVTVAASDHASGQALTIQPGPGAATVTTYRSTGQGSAYAALMLETHSNLSATGTVPLAVTATGPGIPGGLADLAPETTGGDALRIASWLDASVLTPAVGDRYTFAVTYADGTSDSLQADVTGVFGGTPTLVAPAQDAVGVSPTPTFQWSAPASPSTPYAYYLDLSPQSSRGSAWTTLLPSGTTQIAYNADGGAAAAQLPGSTPLVWSVMAVDAYGNMAQASASFTTGAVLPVLYDPLVADTMIDGQLWQTPEYVRTVVGGQAILAVAANHMQSRSVQNLAYSNQVTVNQTRGGRVTTLRADLTLPSTAMRYGSGAALIGGVRLNYQPAANRGFPFPAGNANYTSVGLELYDRGNGPTVRARAYHCDDPACITVGNAGITPDAPPSGFTQDGVNQVAVAAYDQTYTLTISMNETTGQFTWTIAQGDFGTGVSGGAALGAWFTSAGMQLDSTTNGFSGAQLIARVHDESAEGGGSAGLAAEFDNVYVGTDGRAATLYDNFETLGSNGDIGLSLGKWSADRAPNGSVELVAADGLHVRTAARAPGSANAYGTNTSANLLYPANFSGWAVDLTIVSNVPAPGASNYVQMGGAFFNDGSGGPHNGTGDYYFNVLVFPTGASYWVARCLTPNCSSFAQVASGPLPSGSPSFGVGTTHTAWEQCDAVAMQCMVGVDDGAPFVFTAPATLTAVYPPFNPVKYIQSGVSFPAGQSGTIAKIDATAANVQIVP